MANPRIKSTLPMGQLGTLPPELRLKIYRNLMRTPSLSSEDKARYSFSAQLLRTCRTIYNEALPVLYGENLFTACMPTQDIQFTRLDTFFTTIGQDGRDQLRQVELGARRTTVFAANRQWSARLLPMHSLVGWDSAKMEAVSLEFPKLEVVRVRVHLSLMDKVAILEACERLCWEVIVRDEVRPEHFAYAAFEGLRTCRWEITVEGGETIQWANAARTFTKVEQYRMHFSFRTDASRFHLLDQPESVAVEMRTRTAKFNVGNSVEIGPPPEQSQWTVAKVLKT